MAKCDKNLDDIITFEEFCIGMQQDEWRDMLWIDYTVFGRLYLIYDNSLPFQSEKIGDFLFLFSFGS